MDYEERDKLIAAAEEVVGYDGPVYWIGDNAPETSSFGGEDWWESVNDFVDHWEQSPMSRDEDCCGEPVVIQPAEFVFCGRRERVRLSLYPAWEEIEMDIHEGIIEELVGIDLLDAAVANFNDMNKEAMQTWLPDFTKKVRVPRI